MTMDELDRRRFLERSTQAGLGLAAGASWTASTQPAAAAETSESAPGPKIGAFTKSFQDRPIPEVCRLFRKIGLDGLDWEILDPLIEQGRLPHLEGLIENGTRAKLLSISPMLSPVIWTTVATGVEPSRHGIIDFLIEDPDSDQRQPVTSAQRQVPAVWVIGSRSGARASRSSRIDSSGVSCGRPPTPGFRHDSRLGRRFVDSQCRFREMRSAPPRARPSRARALRLRRAIMANASIA